VALEETIKRGKSASLRLLLMMGIGCTDGVAWRKWKSIARMDGSLAVCGVFEAFQWNGVAGVVEEVIV